MMEKVKISNGVKEAYLYKKSKGKTLRCLNCAHYCLIPPGKRGICGVRENQEGKLYSLVYGKAAAVNIDPIEKKPFFHFLPGSHSLSVATVGCNFSCKNCFTPNTIIITDRGPITIREIFKKGKTLYIRPNGTEVRKLDNIQVITHKGVYRKALHAFKHPHKDEILVIKPRYLPPISCTKSHRFFVTNNPLKGGIRKIRSDQLSDQHYLVVPKNYPSKTKMIEGRIVKQSSYYYVKLIAQKFRKSFFNNNLIISPKSAPHFKENDSYYFVPLSKISRKNYSGDVYNIEVEEDHSYLANFISVGNCQNYDISQAPKPQNPIFGQDVSPQQIVELAQKQKLPSISYTYVEPTIFLEYALDTMKLAKKAKLKNNWVTNGFLSKEALELVLPYLDAANVDLKGWSEEFYKSNCGGRLQPVLDTIKAMKKAGVWVEITTLAIPTLSDSKTMFENIAKFIKEEVGAETPWHITQFSGGISWKLQHLPDTSVETLEMGYKIGKEAGLKYVYTGNVPGLPSEDTFCPKCKALCIDRTNYLIHRYDKKGKCPKCNENLNLILK